MGQSVVKNSKKIFSQPGSDPSLNNRVTNLENNVYKITYYEIVSGTSGSLTIPTGATINEGEFGTSGNSILSKINVEDKPTYSSPLTSTNVVVTANLNIDGTWVASGIYTDAEVALVYSIDIKAVDYHNLDNFYIINSERIDGTGGGSGSVTSVGLTMPTAFTVSNSPITSSGDIAVTGAGTTSQYIRGDGTLATFPGLTGFVPYTGATADVDLGTYNLTADHITLNTNPSGAGYTVGTTQWNNTDGTSETLLKGGSVSLKNGVDLVARVVNKVVPNTTLTRAQYQVVKVAGATGGRLSVNLAQANVDLNSADTLGVVIETIATNQEGFIMAVGQLTGINTTGNLQGETWTDGDVIYLSPTIPGGMTKVKPNGSIGHIVVLGYVEYAHVNQGKLYIKIMNGWELEELHDVYIPSYVSNGVLYRDTSTNLWRTNTIPSVLGYTPANDSNVVHITGTETISGKKTFSPSITAASSIAQGTIVSPTLVASANSDVLVGLDVTPTFTNGAFTNLSNIAIRINNAIQFTGTPTGLSDVNGFFGNNTNTTFFAAVGPQPICSAINGGFILLRGNTYSAISNQRGWLALSAGLVSTPTGKEGAISLLTGNDVEKFRLLPNGNVILQNGGTFTDAGYRLDVNGTARIQDLTLIGNASATNQRQLRIGQDSATVDIGSLFGSTTAGAIYINQTTPSGNNYILADDTSNVYLNGRVNNALYIQNAANNLIRINAGFQRHTPLTSTNGAAINFEYLTSANTNQTASTNISNFKITGNSKQWAAGAITNQYWNYFTANTAEFATTLSTITNSYGLFVESATVGTNAAITNNFGIGTDGNILSTNQYLYLGTSSPTTANFAIRSTNSGLELNSQSQSAPMYFRLGTSNRFIIHKNGTVGAENSFTFLPNSNVNQDASTEISAYLGQNFSRQWIGGSLTTQREIYFKAATYNFTTSSTVTNAYGAYFEAAVAGTNATITNNYAAGFNGNIYVANGILVGSTNSALTGTGQVFANNGFYSNANSSLAGIIGYTNNISIYSKFSTGSIFLGVNASTDILKIDTNGLTITDAKDIILNTTTGTKIGTSTTQKLGFYNATPIVQPSAVTTTQGIANALSSLGLLAASTINTSDLFALKPGYTYRGISINNNSTTVVTDGGVTMSTSASTLAQSVASTNFVSKQIRLRYYASVVSTGRYSGTRGSALLWFIHGGFLFNCNVNISDTVYSSTCQQFYGLAGSVADLAYGGASLTALSTLTNLVGIGSEAADTNLQVIYNDATGTCSKIDLGANFPANRTAGAAMTTMYSILLYNAPASTEVNYRVINNETGAIAEGTLTTDLPATTQGLNFFASRAMGTATTNSGQFDLSKLGVYSLL